MCLCVAPGFCVHSRPKRLLYLARLYFGFPAIGAPPPALRVSLGLIAWRLRMFLACQSDYKRSSNSAKGYGGESPPSFLRRLVPGKCWARELAVIESWHSLLAERDVTLGNDEESECLVEKCKDLSACTSLCVGVNLCLISQCWRGLWGRSVPNRPLVVLRNMGLIFAR